MVEQESKGGDWMEAGFQDEFGVPARATLEKKRTVPDCGTWIKKHWNLRALSPMILPSFPCLFFHDTFRASRRCLPAAGPDFRA